MIDPDRIEQYLVNAVRMGLIITWWHQQNDWFVLPMDGVPVEYDNEGVTEFVYLLTKAGVHVG